MVVKDVELKKNEFEWINIEFKSMLKEFIEKEIKL